MIFYKGGLIEFKHHLHGKNFLRLCVIAIRQGHNHELLDKMVCARVIQEFTDFHKISEFLYVSYPLCMPKKHTGTH